MALVFLPLEPGHHHLAIQSNTRRHRRRSRCLESQQLGGLLGFKHAVEYVSFSPSLDHITTWNRKLGV